MSIPDLIPLSIIKIYLTFYVVCSMVVIMLLTECFWAHGRIAHPALLIPG